ncbi:MAG: DUF1846 domain-containing protein [Defluviitaleaceae bacterium]|nr:DUF1846 domain-containing protein [Defluviitaleaceae bacterium]
MSSIGFDNDKYLVTQSMYINKRIEEFGGKLYLEFGGKLFDDHHASRVLPGFRPDSKVRMLMTLADKAEIIIAINAKDIETNKIRSDVGISYDLDVLRLIDAFREIGLYVGGVCVTQYSKQANAEAFARRLESMGIRTYFHYIIPGYPTNVPAVVSDDGYGKNQYIETTRPLVIVTAPGACSGKMATCLSQLYHENLRGIRAGFAKFETFPIWDLPLSHPVNLAYESATAESNDVNMIDPYHLDAYGEKAVNYNRDIEIFPVLTAIFEEIYGSCPYKSPTDMGVNMAGRCITDNGIVSEASRNEIVRRYYKILCDNKRSVTSDDAVNKIGYIMKQAKLTPEHRKVAVAALEKSDETLTPSTAIELHSGEIVTGKTSSLLGASSAALLNALKRLGGIDDNVELISPTIIEPIQKLKTGQMGNRNPRLHTDEVLIALSICAVTDKTAEMAISQLSRLKGCEAHSTVILAEVDNNVFRKLGVNLTSEPSYQGTKLYRK